HTCVDNKRRVRCDCATNFAHTTEESLARDLSWTPKTGQGPKVENRCLKEKTWDSGNNTQRASRRRLLWKRSKANEPSRNWHPATAFIRIKSQIGKSSWFQKLQRFSLVVAFTTTTGSSKKRRSSINRSESCR